MSQNIYRETRDHIAKIVGRPITQQEFGEALGLGRADAARSVRAWEAADAKPPKGLSAIGLGYLRQGLDDSLPEHMGGNNGTDSYVTRNRWPRFVARIFLQEGEVPQGTPSARLGDRHRLALVCWIDEPMFGMEPQKLIDAAAAWTEETVPRYGRRPSAPPPAEQQAAGQPVEEQPPQPA